MSPKRRAGYDIEEITPDHFIVHDERAYGVLRGEGEQRGQLFKLTSWRREGLLARIALRGYRLLTLDDRISLLPSPPEPPPLGGEGWRSVASDTERYSVFDSETRDWRPLELARRGAQLGVVLRAGEVVRRRKGRAAASYYMAFAEREGTIGLRPIDETTALLTGYAQASRNTPLILQHQGETQLLPGLPLPQPYREFLRRVAEETSTGWRISPNGLPYVLHVLERLGVAVE